MDQEKCFTKIHCFQLKQALNTKSAIIKEISDKVREKEKEKWYGLTVAYLKAFGTMMKDLKVEW